MGIIKTTGIILMESNMGDYDKMVTMLTPAYGKIGCAAKGARRPRSLLLAGTQALCFGEYVLYKGTNSYNINSCEIIEVFYNLRTDLDKLRYATHITKIILDVTTENENNYKIMQLFLNTLYTISETDKNKDLILAIFKMRLLSILGYTPNVGQCKTCKKKEDLLYFSIKENGFKCSVCAKQDKSVIQMSEVAKKTIQYAILAPAKKLYSFKIPDKYIKELEIISTLYFNYKLEKEYKLEKKS